MKWEDTKLFNTLTILGWDKKVVEYLRLSKLNKEKNHTVFTENEMRFLRESVIRDIDFNDKALGERFNMTPEELQSLESKLKPQSE